MIIGGDYDDPRNSLTHWYPKIKSESPTVLEAELFDISGVKPTFDVFDDGMEAFVENLKEIPTEDILEAVSNFESERAHIRTEFKSAQLFAEEEKGWVITPDPKQIDEQILHLVDASTMYELDYSTVIVREWIETDTILNPVTEQEENVEVRCIVDEGEVIDWFTDIRHTEFTEEQQTTLDNNFINESEEFIEAAETVVKSLDTQSWSVDFIRSTEGNWFLTDMALYGLYWNERKNEWIEYSNTPDYQPSSILTNRLDEIPDEIREEL